MRARRAGVDTPCLYLVDAAARRICMEYIAGGTVKAWLRAHRSAHPAAAIKLAYSLGVAIARLHDANLIHGDLTTSNFMLREEADPGSCGSRSDVHATANGTSSNSSASHSSQQAVAADAGSSTSSGSSSSTSTSAWPQLVVIDFGLSATTANNEERAVDLHLFEKAIASTHADPQPLVNEALRAYKAASRHADAVLQKLAAVRLRGRKRDMVG